MVDNELIELSRKLGMNQDAVQFGMKENREKTEKQIQDAAKFMGLIKKGE